MKSLSVIAQTLARSNPDRSTSINCVHVNGKSLYIEDGGGGKIMSYTV